jgi:hypothetical protein
MKANLFIFKPKEKQLWLLVKKLVGHGTLSHAEGFVANWKTKGINLAMKTCQRLKCL